MGRPKDEIQAEAFQKFVVYLEENDNAQMTVNDLIDEMAKNL